MCGLCGFKTKKTAKLTDKQLEQREAIMAGLFVANMERGTDSTGLAAIGETEWELLKDIVPAASFIKLPEYKKTLKKNPSLLIGHTRYASTGAVTVNNAHPFKFGDIFGAHNGVVSNYLEIDDKVQVDSEVIFRLLHKHKNDYKKVFKRLSGQFAITWHNLNDPDKVYLVRKDNPLSVAIIPSLNTIFWCSESEYLRPILTAVLGSETNYTLFELKKNTVYTVDSKLAIVKDSCEFKTYEWTKPATTYYKEGNAEVKTVADGSSLTEEDFDWQEEGYQIAEENGCESCNKEVVEGFYYSTLDQSVLCVDCFKKPLYADSESLFTYLPLFVETYK